MIMKRRTTVDSKEKTASPEGETAFNIRVE